VSAAALEGRNGAPRHIAIIMDGNGRWASRNGLPRIKGHEQGARTVRRVVETCVERAVKELTLFAFSMENWKRPRAEVRFLMRLLRRFLVSERTQLEKHDLRLRVIGRTHELPASVRAELDETLRRCRNHRGMIVRLALNYGGRGEIVDAVRAIARDARDGVIDPESVDEAVVARHLHDPEMSDPDLLIRTAGEYRLSNFLLWQLSYSEIHVSSCCWPEFDDEAFEAAIRSYEGRVRKFGGLERARC